MRKVRIRLLYITTAPTTFVFFRGLFGFMKSRGFEVHCLSSAGPYLDDLADEEKVAVHAVKMRRRITPIRDLFALFALYRTIRRIKPHIVHSHTPKGGVLGMIASWLARVQIRIYHNHGLPFLTAKGFRRLLLRWSEKLAFKLSVQGLCVSRSVREIIVGDGVCAAGKVKVLHNGSFAGVEAENRFNPEKIGAEVRKEVRLRLGIPAGSLVIGFVGRIVRAKGIVELSEAWDHLREEFPFLYLLLVGRIEDKEPVPTPVMNKLKLDARVRLTGRVWDVENLYAAIDILASPSYREGFGMVVSEAAAMRLPVVATRIPGSIDSVVDGQTGILVPPGDSIALRDALIRLISDPALRARMGEEGRKRILEKFHPEDIYMALFLEYKQLLSNRGISIAESVR